MKEITNNIFLINNDIEVDSRSYEVVSNKQSRQIISSFALTDVEDLPSLLDYKVSVGFSRIDQTDFTFEDKNTFPLAEVYDAITRTINMRVFIGELSVSNLFAYVRIFNSREKRGLFDKQFSEQVVSRGRVLTENFVDYRLNESANFISQEKTSTELQDAFVQENINGILNYSYFTELFYFFRRDNRVNCFFGIDAESFSKDKNSIELLNNSREFRDYIKNNNPVEGLVGYTYALKEHTYNNPTLINNNLMETMGRVYSFDFQIPKDFDRTEKVGYEVQVDFKDLTTEYVLDVLLPKLRNENRFLRELEIEDGQFLPVAKTFIQTTLDTYQNYLQTIVDNTEKILTVYNGSQILPFNDGLRKIFLQINLDLYEHLRKSIESKQLITPPSQTLTNDFGSVIDVSNIDYGVEVMTAPLSEGTINSYTVAELAQRSAEEVNKFFDGTSATLRGQDGPIDITETSSAFLTLKKLFIENREILDNTKSINNDFSYDETLEFLNSLNKIINKNIDKNAVIYPFKKIEGLSEQEVLTEDQTVQNNFSLNNLVITQLPKVGTERQAERYLSIVNNITKTFEVPSTLRVDACEEGIPITSPQNEALSIKSVNKENFIGNSLISFGVLNKIKSLNNNDFYEPYEKILKTQQKQLASLPVQALFLYRFYSEGLTEPAFLQKENLLNEITNFGLNYYNFKSIFSVKIFLPSENEFVLLKGDVVSSLERDKDYLCLIDHHSNINYGIQTPELLKTSIYNRYFTLRI
tara:strand:- start:1468 stop:3726 length:2259 start_codon:yes stop_codon:yes gene_type:complete